MKAASWRCCAGSRPCSHVPQVTDQQGSQAPSWSTEGMVSGLPWKSPLPCTIRVIDGSYNQHAREMGRYVALINNIRLCND
ncbi:hypothetical protein EJB05_21460 [Eragrostis curvula]|uniref:Uncharacterized protein n=1 Tax=Eragrostis curvula TaxID=38414 RepID=A0A5J9V3C6_9POAL|nr:hypothetical protein EJB05_21460 [Eragrostis curvula]